MPLKPRLTVLTADVTVVLKNLFKFPVLIFATIFILLIPNKQASFLDFTRPLKGDKNSRGSVTDTLTSTTNVLVSEAEMLGSLSPVTSTPALYCLTDIL